MKKGFKFYFASWAILVLLFNAICFITPSEIFGISKYDGAFWAGYIGIMAAFVGQIICAAAAFKAENSRKFFYNLPLITISYTMLVATVAVGAVCMLIPGLPNWVGAIICLIIFAFSATAIIKASVAGIIVDSVDNRIKEKTLFIKNLTVDAESLIYDAKSDVGRAECKKIYDEIRYSDPVSDSKLSSIESEIIAKFNVFTAAVVSGNDEDIQEAASALSNSLANRNNKCKMLK